MARLKDEDFITPTLLKRFGQEAQCEEGDGRFYALMQSDNGTLMSHHPFAPPCVPEQTMFAADILTKLNRELHHDGAWVMVFTHPKPLAPGAAIMAQPGHNEYRRYAILWLDEDADVQFAVEWVEGESEMLDFADVLMAGIHATLNQCEAAWEIWNMQMRDVIDPAEGQTFKRAKGQRASSTRH